MNVADIIVILVILVILGIIVYFTRSHKKEGGCGTCHNDCSSCHAFSNLYEEYKKGEENK